MDALKGYTAQQIIEAIEHLDLQRVVAEMQEMEPKQNSVGLMVERLETFIEDYLKREWTQKFGDSYRITKQEHSKRIIRKSYIVQSLRQAFKELLEPSIEKLIEGGLLREIELKSISPRCRNATAYEIKG